MKTRRRAIRFGSKAWHLNALQTSGRLLLLYRQTYQLESPMITPLDVIGVLSRAKIKFILMGTHGIGGYRDEPRTTDDIDFLVRPTDLPKAIKAIEAAFPELDCDDSEVVARFKSYATGKRIIDLMKPTLEMFRLAYRHSVQVGRHRIPGLELALVCKFVAMRSPHRKQHKQLIDGGDFVNIVTSNLKRIDRPKLLRLADEFCSGGGQEILQHLTDIEAGRPIKF